MTVNVASACASLIMSGTYAGTLTFTSTLTLTSTCTFVSACTIAGTAGTLIPTGAATLTSGGKTLTCALTLASNVTYTLADNWTVNGLVSLGSSVGTVTINQTTTQKLSCAGGLRRNNVQPVAGTAKLELTGGTWDSTNNNTPIAMNLDLAGNVTISGAVYWGASGNTPTLRYVSGTITTTGSTLQVSANCTLDTNGVTWSSISGFISGTITLTSNLAWSGTLTFSTAAGSPTFSGAGTLVGPGSATGVGAAAVTFNNTGGLSTAGTLTLPNAAFTVAGSAGFTVGTLTTASLSASRIHTLTFGNTYTVTTALSNVGTTAAIRQAIKSSSPGNKVVLTVQVGATVSLNYCDPTDIDSSSGQQVYTGGGVITTTNNWLSTGVGTRFLVTGGTGNWNSTSNWATTSGGTSGAAVPIAGDVVAFDVNSGSAAMTVNVASACASLVMWTGYTGTLTFTSTLTLTSTCTFVSACTIAGTAGTLIGTGAGTYTSGGKTLTCGLTLGGSVTYTLGDNWTVNGLVTIGTASSTTTVNGNQITCAGGFRHGGTSAPVLGTTKLVLTGGTWDDTSSGVMSLDVDLAGNVAISGAVNWGGTSKTLKYVSGTITTTGSTVTCGTATIWDTAGVTWNNVSFAGAGITYTLSSTLAWSGTLSMATPVFTGTGTLNGTGSVAFTSTGTVTLSNTGGLVTTGTLTLPNTNLTFAGSAGFTVGTLTTATLTASRIHTLTFGNVYTVTAAFNTATATSRQAIKSSVPAGLVVLTVLPGATMGLVYCDPTDIDSSGGVTVVTLSGVITNSLNWTGSITAGPAYFSIPVE